MKLEGEIVDLGLVCDNWKELILPLRNTWYKKWIFGGEIKTKIENLCLSSQALRRAEWSQRGAPLLHLGWWWRQVTATQFLKKKTSTSRFLWLQLTAGHRTISRNQTQRNKSILSGRRLESVYLRYQDWESAELEMFMSHTYWWKTHIFQWYFLLFDNET